MSASDQSATVWQPCSPGSSIAHRFFVPNYDGHLPFFLQGAAARAFSQKQSVELNEEQLLKGILVTLAETGRRQEYGVRVNREVLIGLLEILSRGFRFKDGEETVLNTAANVRDSHGSQVSAKILRSGVQLLPHSSKIRSDLTTDLWRIAGATQDMGERQSALVEIVEICSNIDLASVHPQAAEAVAYEAFCAAKLSEREREAARFLEEYVFQYVSNRTLKQSIYRVLESAAKVRMEDLEYRQ